MPEQRPLDELIDLYWRAARREARGRKPMAGKSDGAFTVSANGHTLSGERRDGRWSFRCPSWPALADLHHGDRELESALREFWARALAAKPAAPCQQELRERVRGRLELAAGTGTAPDPADVELARAFEVIDRALKGGANG